MTTPLFFPPLFPESLPALGHFSLAIILLPDRFAQEVPPPDAAHLSSWLVDAAALGAILLVFLKIIDHFKRKPSLEQELEKLLRQIRSELNQLRHEQTAHLSEVRGRVEGAHQRVDLLTHDLNNKLQRLAQKGDRSWYDPSMLLLYSRQGSFGTANFAGQFGQVR